MKRPQKRYIIWVFSDGGYHPYEYDSVEECLLHERYTSDFYITESVNRLSAYGSFSEPKKE